MLTGEAPRDASSPGPPATRPVQHASQAGYTFPVRLAFTLDEATVQMLDALTQVFDREKVVKKPTRAETIRALIQLTHEEMRRQNVFPTKEEAQHA